jgi:hypothetical protein
VGKKNGVVEWGVMERWFHAKTQLKELNRGREMQNEKCRMKKGIEQSTEITENGKRITSVSVLF